MNRRKIQAIKMEAMSILASGISHKFNNILTTIVNSIELAIDDIPSGTQARKDLERVLETGMYGSRLINRLLSFSNTSDIDFHVINFAEIVLDAAMTSDTSLPDRITLSHSIEPGEYNVKGNSTLLHQVVINLITNAYQALSEIGGSIHVDLFAKELEKDESKELNLHQGLYAHLIVSDNGPGISSENLKRIFDPFFTTNPQGESDGLGLTMIYSVVKAHKGEINVISVPMQRTSFEIYIPMVRVYP